MTFLRPEYFTTTDIPRKTEQDIITNAECKKVYDPLYGPDATYDPYEPDLLCRLCAVTQAKTSQALRNRCKIERDSHRVSRAAHTSLGVGRVGFSG